MSLLAVALALGAAQAELPELRNVTHQEMDAALRACGFQHLSVFYEPDYQTNIAVIRDVQATDTQLHCAFRAQDNTAYFVEFDQQLMARFYAVSAEYLKPRAIARARAYFAARADLGEPPGRALGQSDFAYARELERHCGPDAIGYTSDEYSWLSISAEWLTGKDFEALTSAIECMTHSIALTDLEIGMIGNEKATEEAGSEAEPASAP